MITFKRTPLAAHIAAALSNSNANRTARNNAEQLNLAMVDSYLQLLRKCQE